MAMITGVDDADIQVFEIEDSVVSEEQAIGSFNLNTANIKLVNWDKKYDGLKKTWLSTIFGDLYVNDQKTEQGTITTELSCYDSAFKFDKTYKESDTYTRYSGKTRLDLVPITKGTVANSQNVADAGFVYDETLNREVYKFSMSAPQVFSGVRFALPEGMSRYPAKGKNIAVTVRYKLSGASNGGTVCLNGRNNWELYGQHYLDKIKINGSVNQTAWTMLHNTDTWEVATMIVRKDNPEYDEYGSSCSYVSASIGYGGNTVATLWIADIMVEELTDEQYTAMVTDLDFEPYVPDEEGTIGKNLLDYYKMEQGSFNYIYGGNNDDTTRIRSKLIPCTPDTKYTFSSSVPLGEFAIVYYQEDGATVISGEGQTTSNKTYTFTSKNNARYMKVRVGNSTYRRTITTNDNYMLEQSETATDYEPYHIDLPLAYPITVSQWLRAICDTSGVALATPEFPNSNVILDHQPYLPPDASYRDAVREIAGSAGSFAQIINNQLNIKWFDSTTTVAEDWFSLEQAEQVPAVNEVVLGRGDLEDNIIYPSTPPENPYELRIDDNQILYQREQETIVPIYNQVNGFNYRIFKLRFNGLRNLKAGQKVSYTDINGDTITTPVMINKIKFLGGDYNDPNAYESEIESVQLKETNTTYKYAGTIVKTVKRTEAHVDKIDGEIVLITDDIQSVKDDITQNYTTIAQSNTLVQNAVDGLMNTFSNSGGNNLVKNSSLYFGSEDNFDYWDGALAQQSEVEDSSTKKALLLKQGTVTQNITGLVPSYLSLRFKYKKVGSAVDTSAKVIINSTEITLEGNEGTVERTALVSSGTVALAFQATDSRQYIVYDLMLNYGQGVYLPYQQAQNELKSTQVSISQEIKVESNTENTVTTIGANGLIGRNKSTNEIVFKQTDTGTYSKKVEAGSAVIAGLSIEKIGDQVWITGI